MKPKIFLVFFSVVFASSYSHSQGAPTEEERELLLDAILWQESSGDPQKVGDGGNAKGAYQIWKIYWKDANVPWEYEKNAWDPEKSREVCRRYFQRYAKNGSLEKMARIHNGGPQGMNKKYALKYETTQKYWQEVQEKMEELRNKPGLREKLRERSHTIPLHKKIVSDNLAKPGGVTLSMAVAENLILPIDIRAALYDPKNNSLLLVGPESEYAFDAGLLLTALRIGSDQEVNQIDSVHFSLDPVTGNRTYGPGAGASSRGILTLMSSEGVDPLSDMEEQKWSGVSINNYDPNIIQKHWKESELRSNMIDEMALQHYTQAMFWPVEDGIGLDGRVRFKRSCDKNDCELCRRGAILYAQQMEIDWLKSSPREWPQSELRFYPEWLKNTRYGEILYKADLVLKELSGILEPNGVLEIEYNRIPWDVYVPPIKLDLFCKKGVGSYGMRLWFDYTTTIREALGAEELSSVFDRQFMARVALKRKTFHTTTKVSLTFCPAHNSIKSGESATFRSASYHHNDSFDLQRVHPYMSVRNHEGGQDLPGVSPHYEYASLQVARYTDTIAKQFPEIQQLVNLFRVSLIAWKLQKSYPKLLDSFQYKESAEEFEEL